MSVIVVCKTQHHALYHKYNSMTFFSTFNQRHYKTGSHQVHTVLRGQSDDCGLWVRKLCPSRAACLTAAVTPVSLHNKNLAQRVWEEQSRICWIGQSFSSYNVWNICHRLLNHNKSILSTFTTLPSLSWNSNLMINIGWPYQETFVFIEHWKNKEWMNWCSFSISKYLTTIN